MQNRIIRKDDQEVIELSKLDPLMGRLITIIGNINVTMRPNYFISLVRSIIGQQISVAAASAIFDRLHVLLNKNITPEAIIEAEDVELRDTGLSKQKVLYLSDLAYNVYHLELNLETLHQLNNELVIQKLTHIKGIGKWTAEMFLIFSLGRMDILAIDDIGIQRGAKWLYQVNKSERRKILVEKAEMWKPHLTIASFYLWEVVHLNLEGRYHSIDQIDVKK